MIAQELLKGSLKTIILRLLEENTRMYGYDISKRVEELTQGKIVLNYGALYPVLHKLLAEGLIKSEEVAQGKRIRIYYSLTSSGKQASLLSLQDFIEYVNTMKLIIQPSANTLSGA
jgi:PadR family transcriptional regulator PadR